MDSDIFQLTEINVSPLCVLPITAEDSKTDESIITFAFCDEPITAADEKMEMDESITDGGVFGLIEKRKFAKRAAVGVLIMFCISWRGNIWQIVYESTLIAPSRKYRITKKRSIIGNVC